METDSLRRRINTLRGGHMNLLSDVRDSRGAGERPNDRNIAKSGIPARSLSDRNGEPAATIVLELEKMLASRRENSG